MRVYLHFRAFAGAERMRRGISPNEQVAHKGSQAVRFRLRDVAEDGDLVLRLRQRDTEAMVELYERYGGLTYSVLLRMLRNPGAAEEQTQEVFLRIWNSIRSFDETRGGLATWIVAIARNRALDYMRSPYGQMDRRGCELNDLVVRERRTSLEKELLTDDFIRTSRMVFQELTEKQREVIRLAYFEGKTQVEIAAEMQAPLGSVKTWVRTALMTLRQRFGARGGKEAICGALAW